MSIVELLKHLFHKKSIETFNPLKNVDFDDEFQTLSSKLSNNFEAFASYLLETMEETNTKQHFNESQTDLSSMRSVSCIDSR